MKYFHNICGVGTLALSVRCILFKHRNDICNKYYYYLISMSVKLNENKIKIPIWLNVRLSDSQSSHSTVLCGSAKLKCEMFFFSFIVGSFIG